MTANDDRPSEPQAPRLRLEALVSYMPTPTCMQVIRVLQECLARHPDQIRLDVYKAGERPYCTPTNGFAEGGKYNRVPSAFVNGRVVASAEAPSLEAVEAVVLEELARGPGAWQ